MADAVAAAAWIERVLGVRVPASEAEAMSAQRAREAQALNRRGIAYPKLMLRWRAAQTDSIGALTRIGEAVLAMPAVRADPRIERVEEVVAELPGLIPDFGAALEDLLDRGINAGSDAAIAKDALATIGIYRQKIGAAATLGAFEQFARKHVGELAVVRTLDGALEEIEQNLRAAL